MKRLNTVKISVLQIFCCITVPIKSQADFFVKINKILKFLWKCKALQRAKTNFKKKTTVGGFIQPDSHPDLPQATVTETICYWWRRSPETHGTARRVQRWLTPALSVLLSKDTKVIQQGKDDLSNKWCCAVGCQLAKANALAPRPHTDTDVDTSRITGLSINLNDRKS